MSRKLVPPAAWIVLVAFAVRLLHVWLMRRSPYFAVLLGDSHGYDEWARRIAAGEWIGHDVFYQAPLYPYMLGVIYALAGRHLLLVRIVQAAIGAASCGLLATATQRLLSIRDDRRARHAGVAAGLMLALYAPAIFFDALIQKSVLDVFFLCIALVVIATIVARAADRSVADDTVRFETHTRTAGGAARRRAEAQTRPPRTHQKHSARSTSAKSGSLPSAAGAMSPSGAMSTTSRAGAAPQLTQSPDSSVRYRLRPWFALGLAMGALALTRENALAFIVVVLAWALSPWPPVGVARPFRTRAEHAGMFVAGVALILAPVAARNAYVGGGFYVTTSQAGPNFYIGNNPAADGTYQSLRFGRGAPEYERQDATELAEHALGRHLTPAEVSSYWIDRAIGFITSQPGAWLKLTARKAALLLNANEVLDTESQEAHAEYSWPLRVLGHVGHFGVLVPLALLGAVVTWPLRRHLAIVYALAGVYAVSVVGFYVLARYRYPLVPMLMIYAGAAAAGAPSWVASEIARRRTPAASDSASAATRVTPRAAWTAAALAAAIVVCNWPMLSTTLMRAVSESNLAVALQTDGRVDDALRHYRRAIELQPDYAPVYNNMGTALRAKGDYADAVAAYDRALALRSDYPEAHYNLANVLTDQGKPKEAAEHFRIALASLPASADVHNNLGIALADEGRRDDAIAEFRAAVAADPASPKSHRNLADALAGAGRNDEALIEFRRAAQLAPGDGAVRYDFGSFLLELDRTEEAIQEFRAALKLSPQSVQAHNNLGIALATQGRMGEAVDQFRAALAIDPNFADAKRNLDTAARAGRR